MSIICFGELLIDFVALESGVSVGEASGFQKAAGGGPPNVAVAVSRLGTPSAFMGQVGDDAFGHFLADALRADNVNVDGLRFSNEARTMLAFVSLRTDGERSFMFYRHPSADMTMTPDDVALDVIDSGKVFHFSSITLINEPSRSATLAAVQYAKDQGLQISFDPNLRMSLWPSADAARAEMLGGLEYAHVVKISDEELEFLTDDGDVKSLWREPTQMIVVTHGAGGCTAYTGDCVEYVPGFKAQAVDTTGAGDGFVAGLLVSLLTSNTPESLRESLRFANAVGALTTTRRGAIPAMPTRAQVEQLLRETQ